MTEAKTRAVLLWHLDEEARPAAEESRMRPVRRLPAT